MKCKYISREVKHVVGISDQGISIIQQVYPFKGGKCEMEIPIKGGNHIVGIPVRVASRHDVVKPLSRYVNMYLGIPINTEGWGGKGSYS